MTFIVLVLLFTLGFGILLAAELLRTRSGEGGAPTSARVSALDSFRPLERLMVEADGEMLEGSPALAKKLDGNRRRVLRAYLRELRAEFVRAFGVCRLLAPVSRDPDFLSTLLRSYAAFHLTYGVMWVTCVTGLSISPARLQQLRQPLDMLRSRATELLDIDAALAADSASQ